MKKTRCGILIFLSLAIFIVACQLTGIPPTMQNSAVPHPRDFYIYEHGFYRIDPDTILDTIKIDKKAVFMPETRPTDQEWTGPDLYLKPVKWHQSDYLEIAYALNQFVWKDSLDDWSLYRITFFSDCRDVPNGFYMGQFTFFKIVTVDGIKSYVSRQILISPRQMGVGWGGEANYPYAGLTWRTIELNVMKVNSDEALKLAEEHGGLEKRLSTQNCNYISLSFVPNVLNYWKIDYFGRDGSLVFSIKLDPDTGEPID